MLKRAWCSRRFCYVDRSPGERRNVCYMGSGCRPCFCFVAMLLMTSHMKRRFTGSIPVLGSSKKMIGGLPIMAMATLSFLLFPPESEPASLCSKSRRFISRSFSSTIEASRAFGTCLRRAYSSRCSRLVRLSRRASNLSARAAVVAVVRWVGVRLGQSYGSGTAAGETHSAEGGARLRSREGRLTALEALAEGSTQ